MKLTNLIAIMAILAFSFGANADVMTLDQTTTAGTIVVSAEIDAAATVTWTSDAFDDGGIPITSLVDVDLGLINPLSADICGDLTSNSTSNLGDLSGISCDDNNDDLHVSISVAGAVLVGGSNTVDIAYTPNPTDFGLLDMCSAAPTLGSACTTATETALVDQDTFTHHVYLGMPLNANSGAGYTPTVSNFYGGDIEVDITVN